MMGGDSDAVPFHVFAFVEWQQKYGIKPPWGKVEYVKLANAFKRIDAPEAARNAWLAFLGDDDPFNQGHAPGLFLATLSKWTVKAIKAQPKPKRAETFPGAARAAEMVRIRMEVERDAAIPESGKRDEMAKRWKRIPLDA